jgi:hypothetical protein
MCYRAYTKKDMEERTAVEDMPVYKIMSLSKDGALKSWYMGEEYKVGKTERLGVPLKMERLPDMRPFLCEFLVINEGFHSYDSRATKLVIRNSHMLDHVGKNMYLTDPLVCRILNDSGGETGNGYLMCWRNPSKLNGTLTLDEFRERFRFDTAGLGPTGDTCVIARCTIPGGAHYYENVNGEIVSDAIRVDSYEYFTKPEEDKND